MYHDPIEDLFNNLGKEFQSFGSDAETFFNNTGNNASSQFQIFTKDLESGFQSFSSDADFFFNSLGNEFQSFGNEISAGFHIVTNDVEAFFNDLGKEFQNLGNEISAGFQTFVDNFEVSFKNFGDNIINFFDNIGNNFHSFFSGIHSFFLGIETLIKILPYAVAGGIGSIIAFKIYKARKAMLNNKRIKKIYKICKRQKINNDIKTINFDKLKPIINQQKWQSVAPPIATKNYSNYKQNRNL